jgi:hypothetical protein
MPDPDMISHVQLTDSYHDIQMADLNVVFYPAIAGIQECQADSDAFPDLVAEQQAIKRSFRKGGQECD